MEVCFMIGDKIAYVSYNMTVIPRNGDKVRVRDSERYIKDVVWHLPDRNGVKAWVEVRI